MHLPRLAGVEKLQSLNGTLPYSFDDISFYLRVISYSHTGHAILIDQCPHASKLTIFFRHSYHDMPSFAPETISCYPPRLSPFSRTASQSYGCILSESFPPPDWDRKQCVETHEKLAPMLDEGGEDLIKI